MSARFKTRNEMHAEGWKRVSIRNCRLCQTQIEFWLHKDMKNPLPFEQHPTETEKLINHFSTCPQADQFRKKKTDDAKPARPSNESKQLKLL